MELPRSVVFHTDDLGLSKAFNAGTLAACEGGLVTSTSLRANGTAFDEAVESVLAKYPWLGVGVHLNLVEGDSQLQIGARSRLSNAAGKYKVSFSSLAWAHVTRDRATFAEAEADMRSQIEAVLGRGVSIDHLDSHQHTHAIPSLFRIVCSLAREYDIPFVRLPREVPYIGNGVVHRMSPWYAVNLVKNVVLNRYSSVDRAIAEEVGVRTNDYFVGVLYTGHMTSATVTYGLAAAAKRQSQIVEVLLHPCIPSRDPHEQFVAPYLRRYTNSDARLAELAALLDPAVLKSVEEQGWQLANFRTLASGVNESDAGPESSPTEAQRPMGGY